LFLFFIFKKKFKFYQTDTRLMALVWDYLGELVPKR